ncbi:MAG: M20/M25/M40 family metallo-hydrolase [Flavobacteriaceae bacterium]
MRKFLVFLFATAFSIAVQAQESNAIQNTFKKEIRALSKRKVVQRAFDAIEQDDLFTMAQHIELTEIAAPPFMEQERAEAFAAKLRAVGIDSVWIDVVGNVMAYLPGSKGGKTVALNAHLDTVFPEGTDVSVTQRNDTLFAPGIGDDTRGLAMLLTIAKTLKEQEIQTTSDVLLVATVGEEGLGDLRGVKEVFSVRGSSIDSWISIDGGDIGRVNNKALGSYRYKVIFDGPGGHSWGAFGLANPHHALGSAMHHFVQAADAYTKTGPRTSYNVGVIEGGTSVNSVPFSSSMLIDVRSIAPYRLDEMEALLNQAVQQALEEQNAIRRRGEALTVSVEKIGNRPSGELDPSLPLIQRAMAATEHFGAVPELTRGSTDSNIPISLGVPAITIGRGGRGGNAHSLDEWWVNDEGHKAIQLALLILVSEAGL